MSPEPSNSPELSAVVTDQEEQPTASTSTAVSASTARSTTATKPLPTLLGKPKKKKDGPTSGIIYISRIPPGMTPQKIKHLMTRWGETGKVYAAKDDSQTGGKRQVQRYKEAWIEFLDKRVAKQAAAMLNAQPIGGSKSEKWRDDIWTMKYLSGFKWEMLGEQVAYERQSHTARLRQELSRSKAEQSDYLRNVELARVIEKRKERKAVAAGKDGTTVANVEVGDSKGKRTYEQRGRQTGGAEDGGKRKKWKGAKDEEGSKKQLDSVLGSIF